MKSSFSDKDTQGLDPLRLRVYTSRLIGMEPSLVLWGGGNTSVKIRETDHLGKEADVLRIKGSGWDLSNIEIPGFAPVRLADVKTLLSRDAMSDEEMVAFVEKSLLEPKAPRPSIETLLHAFLPHTFVDHTHADAILALTNNSNWKEVLKKLYGDEVAAIPYIQPGFELSKKVALANQKNPKIKGIILLNHGLLTFDDDAKKSYERTIDYITRAENYIADALLVKPEPLGPMPPSPLSPDGRRKKIISLLPAIRAMLGHRMVLRFCDNEHIMRLVNSKDALQAVTCGPATPDHVLRTKPWALLSEEDGAQSDEALLSHIREKISSYTKNYIDYYEKYKQPGPFMHDPSPRIILIPQLGMIAAGKTYKEATMALDIYEHTAKVMLEASALGTYASISQQKMYGMEYWPLELFKLTLLPPEKPLSRHIALVTGATGGIGRAICDRLAKEGALVAVTDLNQEAIDSLVKELWMRYGKHCAVGAVMDVTDAASVTSAFAEIILSYGGLDIIVSNAGIAHAAPIESLSLEEWNKSISVNLTGHMIVCQAALKIFKQQGFGGCIVMNASKNVFLPGKDFGAYSAAKAGQTQLGKVLAIEGAQYGVRVNMINADGIFQNSQLWSAELREQRAKAHGIPVEKIEEFYAQRNLLQAKIMPEDVANAVVWLCSAEAAKTTGCTLTVDGGVVGAFPR